MKGIVLYSKKDAKQNAWMIQYLVNAFAENHIELECIYEEGLDVEGGLLTPSGRFKYSEMADIYGEKTTYRLLGMIPVFNYFNVTIYKKGAPEGTPLTNLSSFNFANLEKKYLLIY